MSNDVMTKRVPIAGCDWEFLDVRLYYSLGGYSAWGYKANPRGYYLSATPAKEKWSGTPGVKMICCSPMDGLKTCVLRVSRKSAASAKKAEAMIGETLPALVDLVCSKIGAKVV